MPAPTSATNPARPARLSSLELVRRFLRDRGDDDFARELAFRAVESLPPIDGLHVADIGCGPGYYATAMEDLGATVSTVEIDFSELAAATRRPDAATCGDARHLPFRHSAFDAVLCSNMLEHTPDPLDVIDEIGRVLRVGGWAWVSWTNWLSPWGGHAIAPLHYLGAERGLRAYRRILGEPKGKNLPFDGVWPLHITTVLNHLNDHATLNVEAVEPRYYPGLRAIMRVPGVREVVAWNCVIRLRRHDDRPS